MIMNQIEKPENQQSATMILDYKMVYHKLLQSICIHGVYEHFINQNTTRGRGWLCCLHLNQ